MSVPRTFAVVVAVLAVAAVHPYAPTLVLAALGVWSLLGTRHALQSLSLAVLVKFLNPAIVHFHGSFGVAAWLLLAIAGLRILVDHWRLPSKRQPALPWLLLFSSMVLLESVFFSRYAVVSAFKAVSFTFMAVVALAGFRVTARRSVDWTPWFLGIWLAVAALSLPTLLVPAIGYAKNASGFQGVLNHPQALGVFVAPMVAWLTGTLLFSPGRRARWLYAATPLAWGLLFLTRSRTSFVAVAAGFAVVFAVALWSRPAWRAAIGKGALRPVTSVFAFALLSLVVLQPSLLIEKVYAFVRKGDSEATVAQAFESSRGRGIEGEWQTFTAHPLFGIGFGVSLDPTFKPVLDPVTGLPLSAPVEKGFLPTALLEETGIVGALFFVPFVLVLAGQAFASSALVLPWLFLAAVFVNIGEMIFFSAGGLGLYIWLLIGWAASARRERRHAA